MSLTPEQAQKVLAKRKALLNKPILLDPRFPKQNAFVESKAKTLAAQCSRRAGKSSGLALRFFKAMEAHPKCLCIYLSLTYDSAKSIMWTVLQELNETYKLNCTFKESSRIVQHPNGAKLRLYGADQKNFIKRLKGQKSPAIAIDEAQDFGSHLESLIDDVLTPMMADYQDSWLAICGTPGPIPKGYFFEVCTAGKDAYELHQWTCLENPYMPNPAKTIQDLIDKKKWLPNNPTLLREWRNQWVLDREALWVRYMEELCDYTKLPEHQWLYVIGIDWGLVDSDAIAVLAYSNNSPDTYLVEEIITPKQGIHALSVQIKEAMSRYSNVVKMVFDFGGGGAKMAEDMKNRESIPIEPAQKVDKQSAIELLNDAMRMGKFKAKKTSRFVADSYLIQIDWDKTTENRIVIKKNHHSDIIDATLYAFRESPAYYYQAPVVKPKLTADSTIRDHAPTSYRTDGKRKKSQR